MKYLLSITGVALLATACNIKGVWTTPPTNRPKMPNYSIAKQPFVGNSQIDTQHLYISQRKFHNYDGDVIELFMGFYPDGRLIVNNIRASTGRRELEQRKSFDSATAVGRYTTIDHKISVEYVVQGDGGQYLLYTGEIRKDIVLLLHKYGGKNPFKSIIRYDTLVRSTWPLAGQ